MSDRPPSRLRQIAGDVAVFIFCWTVLAAIVSTDGPHLHVAEIVGLGPSPNWRVVAALDSLVLMIGATIVFSLLYFGLSGLSIFKGAKDLGAWIVIGLALFGVGLDFAVHAGKCVGTGDRVWIQLEMGRTASCIVSDAVAFLLIIVSIAALFLIGLLLNEKEKQL